MDTKLNAIERITRDISDGLILIDTTGTIRYINASAANLLQSPDLKQGVKLASYMASDGTAANDEFFQYILDSVYDKNAKHSGVVKYTLSNGDVRYFDMSTSYTFKDDGLEETGIILQFSDITELELDKVKHGDTIKILIGLLTILSVYAFIYEIWDTLGEPISSQAMTVIVEGLGIASTVYALKFTSITMADFGLGTKNLKQCVKYCSMLTLFFIGVMVIVRLLLPIFSPGVISPDRPFLDWHSEALKGWYTYIPTVVIQEFLTRGVVQGGLTRILPDTYPPAFPIIVSSLFFGALHIHKGLFFMLGAFLLLCIFGVIYRKQKTIWGLCIPHFFLMMAANVLFF